MPSKEYLAYNINFLMEKAGLTSSTLSKATGVAQTTIYKIKDGIITNPTIDTLKPIVEYFNFSIDELINTKLFSTTPMQITYTKNLLPLILFNEIENFPKTNVIRYINTDFNNIDGKYCIDLLEGNSIFEKNSILIIDKLFQYKAQDIVIVKRKADNKLSIKKIIYDDEFFLQSLTIGINHHSFGIEDYIILGVVVGHIKYLKDLI
jgi:transcriptional regulator with XRE-family HTH domain